MKNKKRKSLGVLAVGLILLIPLLWLQAQNEEIALRKNQSSTVEPNIASWIDPPDPSTYPAYDPVEMSAVRGLTGLAVYFNTNGIALINPLSKRISPILLSEFDYVTIDPETMEPIGGQLGSEGGGRFDVAITPNGRLALISNFGDSKVFFVSLTGGPPVVKGMVKLPMFAEDIDIHPSSKWAIVTDGGFNRTLAIINLGTRALTTYNLPSGSYANCIAISPDGKTVLAADYFGGRIYSLLFNAQTGVLTYQQKIKLWKYGTDGSEVVPFMYRPVNVAISPDGKTALLSNVDGLPKPGDPLIYLEGSNVPVIEIDSPGHMIRRPDVPMPPAVTGAQCIVFSRDGTKAYVEANYWIDRDTYDHEQEIQVLRVKGPSSVTRTGAIRMPTYRGTSQLFGVDTMAISPDGKLLYVTNPTFSGGQPIIDVANLQTLTPVKQITTPIVHPDPMRDWPDAPPPPDPSVPEDWIQPYVFPIGIAFPEGPIDLSLAKIADKANPAVGDIVTFTVTISNLGDCHCFDARVSDPLPEGLAFVSAKASRGTYDLASGLWNIPRIIPDGSETLTIKARVNRTGAITNIAEIINQSGYDPKNSNNTAQETITGQ